MTVETDVTRDSGAQHRRFLEIDGAFKRGDLEGLRAALEHPAAFPNDPLPLDVFGPAGTVLEYAIYHSPVSFIRALLEAGANPCPEAHEHAGFPPLIAALSCTRTQPGSPARADVSEILELLVKFGADPSQRGLNDWTALHMAVAERSLDAVRILLDAGADPSLRTRIDDCDTPREMADAVGLQEIANMIRAAEEKRAGST